MKTLSKLLSAVIISAPLFLSHQAQAETYPNQAIRWVVPYPAGGGSDFLARSIGQKLSTIINQPVRIENKPGGNTSIGASEIARSKPDGYSILSADNGTLIFNPVLYSNLSYDAEKELAAVTLLGKFPMILVVGPNSGVNSVEEFVKKAKENPGSISYGSAGAGSPHHLAMELFKNEAQIDIVHVPYRGASPSLQDVGGGQVIGMMVDLAAGAGFIQGNKAKPLAVASDKRLAQLPDVPTFAELGYSNVEAAALVGIVTAKETPKEVITKLSQEVKTALNDPEVNKKLVDFGIEPVGNTPEQYEQLLESERKRWHKLISDLNIKLD